MGMTSNAGQIALLLKQGGQRALRRAREQMKREGKIIEKLARDNAPVLHHDVLAGEGKLTVDELVALDAAGEDGPLARAIKQRVRYDDENRGRLQVVVEIADEGDVGDYAMEMHERLAPYGDGKYELGPLSREKAASGKKVGGKFLERAYLEREDKMVDDIIAEIMKEL